MLNRDFEEFAASLAAHGVECLVVGGDALAAHGRPRFETEWPRRIDVAIDGVQLTVIHIDDFKADKRAVGRLRDLADLDDLDRAD